MTEHFKRCSAPICQESCDKDLVWYHGEEICNLKPFNWIQKKQTNIMNLINAGKKKQSKLPINCLTLMRK